MHQVKLEAQLPPEGSAKKLELADFASSVNKRDRNRKAESTVV